MGWGQREALNDLAMKLKKHRVSGHRNWVIPTATEGFRVVLEALLNPKALVSFKGHLP